MQTMIVSNAKQPHLSTFTSQPRVDRLSRARPSIVRAIAVLIARTILRCIDNGVTGWRSVTLMLLVTVVTILNVRRSQSEQMSTIFVIVNVVLKEHLQNYETNIIYNGCILLLRICVKYILSNPANGMTWCKTRFT